ncbi:hypothetical protein PPYR_04219 [Photinus pyralis]|uniref:Uncharacterized protein n=1 Tax=Photinus pyralis TaxID=7054 RepID=A0A5N4AXL8_PHOPY|nr:uncharacterized protein LOC116164447 isoform X2 [Photinus pyralis]KAB0802033.1 hypothetical protein PPYR_04219 [Photinus pyralis]
MNCLIFVTTTLLFASHVRSEFSNSSQNQSLESLQNFSTDIPIAIDDSNTTTADVTNDTSTTNISISDTNTTLTYATKEENEDSDRMVLRTIESRQTRSGQLTLFKYHSIAEIYITSLFKCAILDLDLNDLLRTAEEVHKELSDDEGVIA